MVAGNGTVNETTNAGGTEINLTGGTLIGHITSSGYIAGGVYHPQSGKLTISGDVDIYADGGVGVLMRRGHRRDYRRNDYRNRYGGLLGRRQ